MAKDHAKALLHLARPSVGSDVRGLLREFAGLAGVFRVVPLSRVPRLLVIDYDPSVIALRMLSRPRTARLVGGASWGSEAASRTPCLRSDEQVAHFDAQTRRHALPRRSDQLSRRDRCAAQRARDPAARYADQRRTRHLDGRADSRARRRLGRASARCRRTLTTITLTTFVHTSG
jgi:hypothetical protein